MTEVEATQAQPTEFPPPIIKDWLNRRTVNSAALLAELEAWAKWMRGPGDPPVRGYELGADVYGPGVLHPHHPVVVLTHPRTTAELVVADPYNHLAECFETVARRVRERQQQ